MGKDSSDAISWLHQFHYQEVFRKSTVKTQAMFLTEFYLSSKIDNSSLINYSEDYDEESSVWYSAFVL